MMYWVLAIVLLAGFVGLSLEGNGPVRQAPLAEAEQDLRLRVINPRVKQFDENGQLRTQLIAPIASDLGPDQPALVETPQLNWPRKGWDARGDSGEISQGVTRLIGNAVASQPALDQRLSAPEIIQTGEVIRAPQGQISTPDFTGQAQEVSINTETRIIQLTQQVSTQLWPAR